MDHVPQSGPQILFECWIYKLSSLHQRKLSFGTPGKWKKRYLVLQHEHSLTTILYYEKQPKKLNQSPKGYIKLREIYTLMQHDSFKNKGHVLELSSGDQSLIIGTDDKRIFAILLFHLQTQTRLRENCADESFVVRPDNSSDMQLIGAKGNMSLIYLSKEGITLALQLSHCVLAHWPLTCVRYYECTGVGQFGFSTGVNSPTGQARYLFNCRRGQDIQLYDLLEQVISHSQSIHMNDKMMKANLSKIMVVESDADYIQHIQRIARSIYDDYALHLGGSRYKDTDSSSSNLPSCSSRLNDNNQQDNVKHISTASEMNRANEIESSYLSMPTNHEGVVRYQNTKQMRPEFNETYKQSTESLSRPPVNNDYASTKVTTPLPEIPASSPSPSLSSSSAVAAAVKDVAISLPSRFSPQNHSYTRFKDNTDAGTTPNPASVVGPPHQQVGGAEKPNHLVQRTSPRSKDDKLPSPVSLHSGSPPQAAVVQYAKVKPRQLFTSQDQRSRGVSPKPMIGASQMNSSPPYANNNSPSFLSPEHLRIAHSRHTSNISSSSMV